MKSECNCMSKEVRRKAKNRASVERRQQGSGLWLCVCVCVGVGILDGREREIMRLLTKRRCFGTRGGRYHLDIKLLHQMQTTKSAQHAYFLIRTTLLLTYINQQRLSAALNFGNGAFQIKRLGQQHLENLLHVDRMTCRAKD